MKFRRGTCGLCKPTKRYKRHHRKREDWLKRDVVGESRLSTAIVKLREHHR